LQRRHREACNNRIRKMKLSLIATMALAVIAPTTHAATTYRNYASPDCGSGGGPTRAMAKNKCNPVTDSTRSMSFPSIDKDCSGKPSCRQHNQESLA
jgi:hypothetical protein